MSAAHEYRADGFCKAVHCYRHKEDPPAFAACPSDEFNPARTLPADKPPLPTLEQRFVALGQSLVPLGVKALSRYVAGVLKK